VMKNVKPLTVGALASLQASKPFEKLEKAEQAGWLALLRKHLSEPLPYMRLATLRTAGEKLVWNTAPRCPFHSTGVISIHWHFQSHDCRYSEGGLRVKRAVAPAGLR
jgi:hypothetical protein